MFDFSLFACKPHAGFIPAGGRAKRGVCMVSKRFRDSLIRVEQVGTDTTPEFEIKHSKSQGILWQHSAITLSLPEAEALVELLQLEIQKAKQKMEELGV